MSSVARTRVDKNTWSCTALLQHTYDPSLSTRLFNACILLPGVRVPCGRNTATTLRYWRYNNVVPSLRFRPTLLSGHAVSNYLSSPVSDLLTFRFIYLVALRDSFHLRLDPTLTEFVQRCRYAITLGASNRPRTCFGLSCGGRVLHWR